MRKRLIQVLALAALTLGLLTGSGLVRKAPPAQLAKSFTPLAIDGGGSNGF